MKMGVYDKKITKQQQQLILAKTKTRTQLSRIDEKTRTLLYMYRVRCKLIKKNFEKKNTKKMVEILILATKKKQLVTH